MKIDIPLPKLQHQLFGLLRRAYKNPWHPRIPSDHATAIRKWLDRNDPAVMRLRVMRAALAMQIAADHESLIINSTFADGVIPPVERKTKRKRGRRA